MLWHVNGLWTKAKYLESSVLAETAFFWPIFPSYFAQPFHSTVLDFTSVFSEKQTSYPLSFSLCGSPESSSGSFGGQVHAGSHLQGNIQFIQVLPLPPPQFACVEVYYKGGKVWLNL